MTASEPPDREHPDRAHPDPEALAEFDEGLLSPPRAAEVWSHLTSCTTCRDDVAALQQVPGRLAAAGDAGPMPADLVARLDTLLATEGRSATVTITPLPDLRRRRSGRDNRVLQAAAAAVLVLAATAVGVSAIQGGGDSDVASKSADAGGDSARELSSDGSVPVLSTGTDYTPDSVAAAVPGLLAGDGPPVQLRDGPEAANGATDARARLGGGAALSGCVSALADDPDTAAPELPTPLVVDIATFEKQEATVIVLPTPGEAGQLDVYVVGPACAPADAKVLHFARVARP